MIWDWPTRLFHWSFAGGILAAAFIALALGEHHTLFPYHAILGLTLALILALRLVWGVIGTRHARFRDFAFGPRAVLAYAASLLGRAPQRHSGHNPGSAWVIFALLAVAAVIITTGVMLGRGFEAAKEIHETAVWVMLALAAVHVLGVAFHTLRYRENITASMVHGRKDAPAEHGIPSAKPITAIVAAVLVAAWTLSLVTGFDPARATTTIPGVGVTLRLAESPEREPDRRPENRADRHDDDD